MTTKLSKATVEDIKRNVAKLLDCGVRYTNLNMTPEEMGEFWHRGFPDELMDAYTVLAKHGVGIEYHAVSSSVGFAVPIDTNRAMSIRLAIPGGNGGFINLTRSMAKDHPKVTLEGAGQTEAWPVIDAAECEKRLGKAKWDEFWLWAQAADTMSKEIALALDVSVELLNMIKTAGQLQRMVPEFENYLTTEHRRAMASQKRSSQLPYEWAAYDRSKVEAAMTTLAKCHLIRGIVKPETEHMTFGGDSFSWAIIRDIEQ